MTKKFFVLLAIVLGILGMVSICAAGAVEYVRVPLYGYGFHYVPGTDVCMNDYTGDTRTETAGGTWRSLMPYPQGRWVVHVKDACGSGTPGESLAPITAPISRPMRMAVCKVRPLH